MHYSLGVILDNNIINEELNKGYLLDDIIDNYTEALIQRFSIDNEVLIKNSMELLLECQMCNPNNNNYNYIYNKYNPYCKYDYYDIGGRWHSQLPCKFPQKNYSKNKDIEFVKYPTNIEIDMFKIKYNQLINNNIEGWFYKLMYKDFNSYLISQTVFSTSAVVLPNGTWIDFQNNQFGLLNIKSYTDLLNNSYLFGFNEEDYLVLVDCHI